MLLKRKTGKVFIGFFIIAFFYYLLSQFEKYQRKKPIILSYDEPLNLQQLENRNWIVNNNILQYSAYSIFTLNSINFDVLLIFNRNSVYDLDRLRCIIRDESYNNLISLTTTQFIEILEPSLFKVRCEFHNYKEYNIQPMMGLQVAVIYESDFNFNENQDINENLNAGKLPYTTLTFHTAKSIDSTSSKLQAITHCTHMLHGIERIKSNQTIKFENWINIQKKIGIHNIQFYVYKINNEVINYISNTFGNFVQHPTSYESICGWSRDRANRNSKLYYTLHQICNSTYEKYFSNFLSGYHDRICMNDCYINYKYKYELLTNYDIDEVIFPRLMQMNETKKYESLHCNKVLRAYEETYNIYDYAIRLMKDNGRKKYPCLMFKNVVFLPRNAQLGNFLNQLESKISKNKDALIPYYDSDNKVQVKFKVETKDFSKASEALDFHKIMTCFIKRDYTDAVKIADELKRHIGVYFPSRWGKSIINTNLTETINHHSCDAPSNLKHEADLNVGFASHFRSNIDVILNEVNNTVYPFASIVNDIEFSIFLNNLFA